MSSENNFKTKQRRVHRASFKFPLGAPYFIEVQVSDAKERRSNSTSKMTDAEIAADFHKRSGIISQILMEHENYIGSLIDSKAKSNQTDKSRYRGGGDKGISKNQISLVYQMAAERDVDADSDVRCIYNKEVEELLGYEANEYIRHLKVCPTKSN